MPQLSLIVDIQNRQLARAFNSSIAGALPRLFQGDTLSLALRFVTPTGDASAPYADIDSSGFAIKVGIGSIGAIPTAGTFTLTDPETNATTAAIPFGADIPTCQAAIQTLPNWSAAVVTGKSGGPWIVTNGTTASRQTLQGNGSALTPLSSVVVATVQDGDGTIPEIQQVKLAQNPIAFQDAFTSGPAAGVSVTQIQAGSASQNEIQNVTLTAAPYLGSFSLNFGVGTSDPIAWNATSSDVQAALEANPAIGAGNVSVNGGTGGPWQATFTGTLKQASQALMTGVSSGLTAPSLMLGSLALNTGGIEEAIGTSTSISQTLEIQVTPAGGAAMTVLQTSCSLFNDLIEGAPSVPVPVDTYYTKTQADARYAALSPASGGYRFTTSSIGVAFQLYDTGTSAFRTVYLNNGALVIV